MNFINPHKSKYHNYYMNVAIEASKQSVAVRRKVGTVIVLPTGLMATGWNGQPSGFDNNCEWLCEHGKGYDTGKTMPDVIHSERNALDKLALEGISPKGSILFTTTAPCMECAKSIANVGVSTVYYLEEFSKPEGIEHLIKRGVKVHKIKSSNFKEV